jgi:hypothetical protein
MYQVFFVESRSNVACVVFSCLDNIGHRDETNFLPVLLIFKEENKFPESSYHKWRDVRALYKDTVCVLTDYFDVL